MMIFFCSLKGAPHSEFLKAFARLNHSWLFAYGQQT
jgi:hypothetical protein